MNMVNIKELKEELKKIKGSESISFTYILNKDIWKAKYISKSINFEVKDKTFIGLLSKSIDKLKQIQKSIMLK